MSRKYHPDRVLNPIRRRIFRTHITRTENFVAAGLVLVIVLAGAWVLAQRDNYDPGERDISIEALREGSIAQLPYEAPLVRWREPGSVAGAAGPDLGPFSSSLLAGGWQLEGRIESYDASNLYEKINGQAEQYLKFGFEQLHWANLEQNGVLMTLELYDQSEFRNALGVFASQRDATQSVANRGPLYFYRTSVGAIGLAGARFFKITGSESSEVVSGKTDQLLDVLGELPRDAAGSDAPFNVLADGLGLPFEDISYEKENALQYDFFGDVWFGMTGEHRATRVFIHRAETPDEVSNLFDQLVAEQEYEYTPVEKSEARALMKHEFLDTFFAVARRDDWLYGLDGAPDQATAVRTMTRLEKELP
ncbi:MAG: hypothetical protein JSV80_07070 [Acidobacteriota bacterium]|nr:MAG: hypothetical protein JSV80_07070 [Acidobacteriota bacterium]